MTLREFCERVNLSPFDVVVLNSRNGRCALDKIDTTKVAPEKPKPLSVDDNQPMFSSFSPDMKFHEPKDNTKRYVILLIQKKIKQLSHKRSRARFNIFEEIQQNKQICNQPNNCQQSTNLPKGHDSIVSHYLTFTRRDVAMNLLKTLNEQKNAKILTSENSHFLKQRKKKGERTSKKYNYDLTEKNCS
ncbi:hypothetical protein RFI_26022 [Reticulomyxa filosa]|uniref:Uncharacterized protein n=1 Tax=Reticulomyxa filosa TaxID=46433 RepID=X6MBW9_RETFI|nr:hypothetical protein RFI_26022 [Reticulomyxa filosa]|eukprot:ETO11354.1 hypothetical protein RFI_26022 [Reticulomyxa filosa]